MTKPMRSMIVGCALLTLILAPGTSVISPRVEASSTLATITGTVKDDAGKPLGGALVSLLESALDGRELKSLKTDYDGTFSTSMLPGMYRLRAAADGYRAAVARVALDPSEKFTYNFALKRENTLVDQRGDRDDYRWIGRSVPRHVLHLDETGAPKPEETLARNEQADRFTDYRPSFRGVMQFMAASSMAGTAFNAPASYGTNFAVAGTIRGVEMAVVGQRGFGGLAPQRVEAIASLRPAASHQITASVGYGQVAFGKPRMAGLDGDFDEAGMVQAPIHQGTPSLQPQGAPLQAVGSSGGPVVQTLNQVSVSATGQWQVFQPLLVIYGFDYARFVGSASRQTDSILPRLAFQYSPNARWKFNASLTPGSDRTLEAGEGLATEDITANFLDQTPEVAAFSGAPILDRSRRLEFGLERVFDNGQSAVEASAFYDIIAGHGIGVLALPLEASPETERAFRDAAYRAGSLNSVSRGVRLMYSRHLTNEVTASVGYSFGSGAQLSTRPIDQMTPANMLRNGFFQVATAKLDVDLSERTGTRISTVVRLSPDAVVFAIDPFAGRMSVYDPNINVYVTQQLPNFGFPWRWQAIVDIRNILNQLNGAEDGAVQLVATRSYRSIRGGVMFSW